MELIFITINWTSFLKYKNYQIIIFQTRNILRVRSGGRYLLIDNG